MFGKKSVFKEGKFDIPEIEPLVTKTAANSTYGLQAKAISMDDIDRAMATMNTGAMTKSIKDMEKEMYEKYAKELEAQKNEEWIWIEGYKGTNKDMKCRDYQYELNKQHDMPEDAIIQDCSCGFHLCKDLTDVFGYYGVGNGNRFFKVSALVRKKDYEEYGNTPISNSPSVYFFDPFINRDKLAAKSIIFTRECTPDEIFEAYAERYSNEKYTLDWSEEDKKEALATNIGTVAEKYKIKKLVSLGYSEPMSKLLVKRWKYDEAVAAASQEDLSMDMRIAFILMSDN